MKILILMMSLLSAVVSLSEAQVTRVEADSIIQRYIQNENIEGHWLYFKTTPVPGRSEVAIWTGKLVSPDFDSWVYFIDENPYANWSHKCRYVFISTGNGKVIERSAIYPPANLEKWKMIFE